MLEYDDNWGNCQRTYSTLRIYPGDIHPDEVTRQLRVSPSKQWVRSDAPEAVGARRMHGWFLTSRDAVDSLDTRLHLDFLVRHLLGQEVFLEDLRQAGGRIDIICFWQAGGPGGPQITPQQMEPLGRLGVSVSWNIYPA